jgi:acyl-CoA thioester hydrolase
MSSGKLLLRAAIPVRWRDLDAFDHVNNAAYLTFIEEARLLWFASLHGAWRSSDFSPVVAAIQLNYRRSLQWPANIIVELYCERAGTSSLTVAHRIIDANDESILYSDGQTTMVWINPSTTKSVPLPPAVRLACQ